MEIVDYLLARKKAGGGSDVTIEQLSVTENGTYSEQGIAYSPVVVNVPAPENSYQLTDIPTGTVSTIEDGTDLPMSSLKVGIEPVQDLHGYDHPWAGGAGKNLFYIDSEYTIANETYMYEVYVKPNTSYTLSSNCPSPSPANLYFNGGSTEINGVGDGRPKTFNSDEEGKLIIYVRYKANVSAIDLYTAVKNGQYYIQLEEGSTATSYEPYSNICPISGWTAANVTRIGKNLFDKVNCGVYNGYISGTKVYDSTNHKTIYIPCKPNTTYSCKNFSGNNRTALSYSSEVPSASADIGYAIDGIITTDANAKYLLCYCYNANSDTVTFDDVKNALDIELGSVAPTSYSPYNGTTYNIQFTDGDNPLTVYGGTLDVTTGELVVDRKLLLINGDSNVLAGAYKMSFKISIPNDAKAFASATLWGSKCNMMTEVVQESSWGIPATYSFAGNLNQIYFKLTNDLTDVDELKAFLTENPIEICYFIDAPTTYHLTPTQVRTLVGTNNIWADTGDILEGKYFKEL